MSLRNSVQVTRDRRWLALLMSLVIAGLASAQSNVGKATPPNEPAANQERSYWSSRWNFRDLDIEKFDRRLKSIGIDSVRTLRGRVNVQFDVGIPWKSLNDGSAYRFDGVLTSQQLTVDTVTLRDLETVVEYRNGVARLKRLKFSLVDQTGARSGDFTGAASIELLPRGNASAELRVDNLSIVAIGEILSELVTSLPKQLPNAGLLSGNMEFQAPLDHINETDSYQAEASLHGKGIRVESQPPFDVRFEGITLQSGRLKVSDFALTADVSPNDPPIHLFGHADLPVDGHGKFDVALFADDLSLDRLATADDALGNRSPVLPWAGQVDLQLWASGRMEAFPDANWTIQGSIASPNLCIMGVDVGLIEHDFRFTASRFELVPRSASPLTPQIKLESIAADYRYSEALIALTDLKVQAFGGSVCGELMVPRQEAAELRARVTVEGIRPDIQIDGGERNPDHVVATWDGELDWHVPVELVAMPHAHRGNASLTASAIELAGEKLGDIETKIVAADGAFTLTASARVLGGTAHAATVVGVSPDDSWSDLPKRLADLECRFEGLEIERAFRFASVSRSPLTGQIGGDIHVDFRSLKSSARQLPHTKAQLELANLRYRSKQMTRRLIVNARIEQDLLHLDSCVGDYAGGWVRVLGRITLLDERAAIRPRADLQVNASRIDVHQGLWFLGEQAASLQGRVSLSGTLAATTEAVRMRGNTEGRDLQAFAMPIGVAHSRLTANLDLRSMQWRVAFPSVRSRVGGGYLEGELEIESSIRGGIDLASRWKTRRVDVFRLSQRLSQSGALASGKVSGEASLSGQSIESIDDLNGRFDFELEQTRGAAIPGLAAASDFLGPVSLVTQSFDQGRARGIVGRGVVAIDEFWLSAPNALVRADGKVFLASGRMDLDAVIATGDFDDIALDLGEMAQRYALNAVIPASAVWSVTELFRDRTIVLSAQGTVRNPIIRLRPVETFREEVARFLIREGKRLVWMGITSEAFGGIDDWSGPF